MLICDLIAACKSTIRNHKSQILGDSSQARLSVKVSLTSVFLIAFVLFVENYGTGIDRCS